MSSTASSEQRGHYKDGDLVFLWKSDPIPTDLFCIRGALPDAFNQRVSEALRNLDLSSLDEADRKIMAGAGITRLVPQSDGTYDGIRDLVKAAQYRSPKAELTEPQQSGERAMLRIRDLTMRYPNGKVAFVRFSFVVSPGEPVVRAGRQRRR